MTETPVVVDSRPDRGLLSRWRRRLGGVVLVVVTLLIGHTFVTATPDKDASERPFIRSGAIGELIDGRTFDAKVVGMRGAAEISGSPFLHDTQGVWVIVRVRVVARDKPIVLSYAALRDGEDRLFLASERLTQPFLGKQLQPGIPVEGEIVFEVPKNSKQLSVRLAEPIIDRRMEAIVEVSLPIGSLENWIIETKPVRLAKTGIVP